MRKENVNLQILFLEEMSSNPWDWWLSFSRFQISESYWEYFEDSKNPLWGNFQDQKKTLPSKFHLLQGKSELSDLFPEVYNTRNTIIPDSFTYSFLKGLSICKSPFSRRRRERNYNTGQASRSFLKGLRICESPFSRRRRERSYTISTVKVIFPLW